MILKTDSWADIAFLCRQWLVSFMRAYIKKCSNTESEFVHFSKKEKGRNNYILLKCLKILNSLGVLFVFSPIATYHVFIVNLFSSENLQIPRSNWIKLIYLIFTWWKVSVFRVILILFSRIWTEYGDLLRKRH